MSQKISLSKLAHVARKPEPLPVAEVMQRQIEDVGAKRNRDQLLARLIAQEYLRNGLNFEVAYLKLRGRRPRAKDKVAVMAMPEFEEEIARCLGTVDIEREQVLRLLWVQASMSPLDFMNDEGKSLTIAQMKKLPRELQAMIEVVNVNTVMVQARDGNGNLVSDDDGVPLMVPETKVSIRVADKARALKTIAEIGKMIGPKVVNNTANFNFAALMVKADGSSTNKMLDTMRRIASTQQEAGDAEA